MVNSGPEVVFHSGNLVSTSPLYLGFEVDSRPAGVVRTWKSGHYLYELLVDV